MEVKINELRIGNIIYQNDVGFCVNKIQHIKVVREIQSNGFISSYYLGQTSFNGENINNLRAIPLTEEWLKNLGFENDNRLSISINSLDELCWSKIGSSYELRYQTKGSGFTRFFNTKYVHQLQNLYFALTGEELTIK